MEDADETMEGGRERESGAQAMKMKVYRQRRG